LIPGRRGPTLTVLPVLLESTVHEALAVDVSRATFDAAVIARSHALPVLCDCWAAWCQPCRMLAPLVERTALAYAGRAEVVKIDTDAEAELAARFGVRSLPTLALFRRGELVEALVGMQPESALAALIERHLERPAEREREAALAAAAAGDVDGALTTLARLAAAEPGQLAHVLAQLDVLLAAGRYDDADALLARLPMGQGGDPALAPRHASLALGRAAAAPASGLGGAARAFLAGEHAAALGRLLELMRQGPRAEAAGLLRAAFVLLGEANPLVADSRRRMAALMH
jgi:putative thioredoxin